ncbi:hypothetical protein RHGRI_009304 [Rhododendron griersonianum]|uniref:RING-type E3 ubiquitin transferase n=1 Tax=Rhododendron griersonianum TaxID=479676 RepID=A0AAV6L6B6_9ERIC|nr:hypothetical protein RHGRI_009304 [Rhododendron griersonianum]
MWNAREINEEKLVAVAIDKDKRSQVALKWAIDNNVISRGQTVRLIHVHQSPLPNPTPSSSNNLGNDNDGTPRQETYDQAATAVAAINDMFLSFRCFCSRREVLWEAVTLEEQDIAKALIDYISFNRVDTLVLGSPSKKGISRLFKSSDIPSTVLKGAPYFCNVYVISKGKVASMRSASHPLPSNIISATGRTRSAPTHHITNDHHDTDFVDRVTETRLQDEMSIPETDISYVCSGRLSTDSTFFAFYDNLAESELITGRSPRSLSMMSVGARNFDPIGLASASNCADLDYSPHELSPSDKETSCLPLNINELVVEEKMRRLELQMKQTMDMYHAACREALTAKQKARELQLVKMEYGKRLEEAERAKEEAMLIAEEEREKTKVALKATEAAYKKAEKEAQKRIDAEIKAFKETENKKLMLDSLGQSPKVDLKYQSLLHIVSHTTVDCTGNHVALSDVNHGVAKVYKNQVENEAKELFLPFRAFCTRKEIKCNEVIMEDIDIARAICDYVKLNLVQTLVVAAPTKNSFVKKFMASDVPSNVSKMAPEFCNVYVISKGRISSVQSATIPFPNPPPHPLQIQSNPVPRPADARPMQNNTARAERTAFVPPNLTEDTKDIKSPFNRGKASGRSYGDLSPTDSDITFVSYGRPTTESKCASPLASQESGVASLLSYSSSDRDNRSSFESQFSPSKSSDLGYTHASSSSSESANMSWSSSNQDEMEAEMRRLKQELKQTLNMYSTARKEAVTAKHEATELHNWKNEELQRLGEARLSGEATLVIIEREKAKTKAAIEKAEAAQRIAELEAQKRKNAEMKVLKEAKEKKKVLDVLAQSNVRYRKYTIEEIEAATDHFSISLKIGEGGYGPVFKCFLDHTPVAVKVLRPDAAQGRSQFQQEVEVLSCIRHPNMVLLLGACPEYGCLVYDYMANGSLEDRLFRQGNTPPLPWQLRFRIAAEIGTGLLFLHQTKPEPIVHRDLKPANILLDSYFVSKISDVGLARLVPPNVVDSVTEYHMTSAAGTFCYIDPEYQQTGMLGTKSDIYSLGIMLLQIVTAKPPMGLTHHVEQAIDKGIFAEFLDPSIPDWPVEEALSFAQLALKCAELRRKDRPDLKTVVLPELNRLKALGEEKMPNCFMMLGGSSTPGTSPSQSQASATSQDVSDPILQPFGSESSQSRLSSSSHSERRSS